MRAPVDEAWLVRASLQLRDGSSLEIHDRETVGVAFLQAEDDLLPVRGERARKGVLPSAGELREVGLPRADIVGLNLPGVGFELLALLYEDVLISGADAIEKSGKALVDKLTALEGALVQTRVVDGQTVINFPMRLNQFFIYLRSAIDDSDQGTTDGQRDRLGDLSEQWQTHQRTAAAVLGDELAGFNRLVRDRNVPAVVVK